MRYLLVLLFSVLLLGVVACEDAPATNGDTVVVDDGSGGSGGE